MNFGQALEAMKEGKKIKLPHWKDDVFISIYFPDDSCEMTHCYMYATSRFGKIPWVATQIEILSNDWIIVE